MTSKVCSTCKQDKDLSSFYKSTRDKYQGVCKDCKRQINKVNKLKAKMLDNKICSKCGETRSLNQFLKNKRAKDGLNYSCKICKKKRDAEWFKKFYPNNKINFTKWKSKNPKAAQIASRDWKLQNSYGITLAEYEQIAAKQNHVCAICKKPESTIDKRTKLLKNLSVDHCHKTLKIRGLLCSNCNTALGLLKESSVLCRAAATYIEETSK